MVFAFSLIWSLMLQSTLKNENSGAKTEDSTIEGEDPSDIHSSDNEDSGKGCLFTHTVCVCAVSYTHLDVYKRQVLSTQGLLILVKIG